MLFTSWPYFLVLCRESLCLHLWVTHNVYLPWFGRIMTQFILHHGITLLEDGMLRWAKIRWTWCVRITVCYLFCIWEIPKCPLWSYFPEFSLHSRDACLIIFITVFIVMLSVGKEAMTSTLLQFCGKVINCLDVGGESSSLIAAGGSDPILRIWDPRKPGGLN